MTAGGTGGAEKTAEELLAQLLNEKERLAVLKYSRDKDMESDDAVYFLVALLKMFAHAYDQMLAVVAAGDRGRNDFEQSLRVAKAQIDSALARWKSLIGTVVQEATDQISFHTGEIRSAAGELKILREQMAVIVKDAREAFAAYERLGRGVKQPVLSKLFHDRMIQALDQRVPVYDQTFRALMLDTISLGMGRYFLIIQIELVAMAALLAAIFKFG
ncbi:hypothetical protein [Sphingomonas sp.]|uniref:hypothetical protein n=1 Tax=Sphingomonas sp. TaxID=28214 RepID=UPI003B00CD46